MEKTTLQKENKHALNLSRFLGVSIITLLLASGVYTAMQIGPHLPDTFNRIAAALVNLTQTFIPGEKIILTSTINTVGHGKEIVLSWTHQNKRGNGTYALSYPCVEQVYFSVKTVGENKQIPCETFSDVENTDNTLILIASSLQANTTSLPVTMYYKNPDNNKRISSNIVVHVLGQEIPVQKKDTPTIHTDTATQEKPEAPTVRGAGTVTPGNRSEKIYPIGTTTKPVTSTFGKVDLAPRIIAVGTINKITNEFTATTSLTASDRIAVRFEIENVGTADSGHWQFSAVLPTFPSHIFQSEGQQSLGPGDKIEYTIGFDNVEPDTDGRFVINVDPTNSLSEASETNNIATTTIRANSR